MKEADFMNKRITSLLGTLCAFVIFAVTVMAVEVIDSGYCGIDDTGANVSWSFDNEGTLYIGGTGAIPDYEKLVRNQPWWSYRKKITKLIIGDGISRIGNRAFQGASSITSATLGQGIKSIGDYAFQGCTSLMELSMPEEDVRLGAVPFNNTPIEADALAIESVFYRSGVYFERLSQVELTGNYRNDIINIAKSQVGYHAGNSEEDFDGCNVSGSGKYTEYGRYFSVTQAWCSEFASWCIRLAGVPFSTVASSYSANVSVFIKDTDADYYTWEQTVYGGGKYTPRMGDILLWSQTENRSIQDNLNHTSILERVEVVGDSVNFYTLDGNVSNQVKERKYALRLTDGITISGTNHLYYIVSPNYENADNQKFDVTFNANGGMVNIASKKVSLDGLYGPLPIAKRNGFTFLGWYTQPNGGIRINMYKPVHLNDNQTLYARWSDDATSVIQDVSVNGNNIFVKFSRPVNNTEIIALASYSAINQMTSFDSKNGINSESIDMELDVNNSTYLKVFLLDSQTLSPRCGAYRKNLY